MPHEQHGPAFVAGVPEHVAVIGAGMVGLSTAWFLQEAGVQVTVYDRDRVGAGASWGNAGWLTPALTAPLPEPAVLRYGLRAVLSPRSPVYLPLRADPTLVRFLTGFVRHSTERAWRRGMAAYAPLNERALEVLSRQGALIERIAVPEFLDVAPMNARGGFAAAESYAWHRYLIASKGDVYDPRVSARILRGETAAITGVSLVVRAGSVNDAGG